MPPKKTERRSTRVTGQIQKRNENTTARATQSASSASASAPFTGGKRKSNNTSSQPAKKTKSAAKPPRKTAVPKKPAPKAAKAKTAVPTKAKSKTAAASKKTPKAAAPAKATKKAVASAKKRKMEADDEDEDVPGPATKKAKVVSKAARKVAVPKASKTAKVAVPDAPKVLPVINTVPTQVLDLYVFGEGIAGELGLGAGTHRASKDVTRPRLNTRLGAEDIGVVQLAVGGMHSAALTRDNKIFTWGCNDDGALGRDTARTKKEKEQDGESESGLNPLEAEPRAIDNSHFPAGTTFAQVACCDSATFVVTTTGQVWGWGQFKGNDGAIGFEHTAPLDKSKMIQRTPMLISEVSDIISLATGNNHVLALSKDNKVWGWGADEQSQLARISSKVNTDKWGIPSLRPSLIPGIRSKKIVRIGCGNYHSLAVTADDNVYAWGLNDYTQCGLQPATAGGKVKEEVKKPKLVQGLTGHQIEQVTGGSHHTIARAADGSVLVWGSIESCQSGLDLTAQPADLLHHVGNRARYLTRPTVVPGLNATFVATGNDTCAVITTNGQAHTWGFNSNFQAGQGPNDEEIEEPTLIDNTATRGKTLTFAGIGGQFGIVCGIPQAAAPAQPAAGNVAQAVVAPAIPTPAIVAPAVVAPAIPEAAAAANPEENVGQAVVAEQSVAVEESVAVEKDVIEEKVVEEGVADEDTIMEEESHLEDTLLPKADVEEAVAEAVAEDRMEE